MSANFESLQAEYDNAQDTIEALKKQVADVNRDFKNNLEQSNETKFKLAEAEVQLAELKETKSQLEANFMKVDQDNSSLNAKLGEKETEVIHLRCEKDRLTKEVENVSSKLEAMTGVDKKHDLLDLELEEAEVRIALLTT